MRECPQCRIHIPSRRSLRPDVNFDNLIKSIYGDIEKLEKYEEEEVARANKKTISDGKNKGVLQRNMQKVRTIQLV
jgi:E3 ubiquitin-protein ligase RNF1/2